MKQFLVLLLLILALAAPAAAQTEPIFDLPWSTLGSGINESENGRYSVSGTISPIAANTAKAGQFTLNNGFWTVLYGSDNVASFEIALPIIRK